MKYTEEHKKKVAEIKKDFNALERRDDVDYRQHDTHSRLNLNRLIVFWKYRASVFSSRKPEFDVDNVERVLTLLRDVHDKLSELLKDVPLDSSANDYFNERVNALEGDPNLQLVDINYQTGQARRKSDNVSVEIPLVDMFDHFYWKHIPDKFKFKEIVKEVHKCESPTILDANDDLVTAYRKSECKVKKSFKNMLMTCIFGFSLMTGLLWLYVDLPFQKTIPLNLLILIYCSVIIRRYLIDARNRDLSKTRLQEYKILPKYDDVDDGTKFEIIKDKHKAFNRISIKDQTWADILKPVIGRFLNPSSD